MVHLYPIGARFGAAHLTATRDSTVEHIHIGDRRGVTIQKLSSGKMGIETTDPVAKNRLDNKTYSDVFISSLNNGTRVTAKGVAINVNSVGHDGKLQAVQDAHVLVGKINGGSVSSDKTSEIRVLGKLVRRGKELNLGGISLEDAEANPNAALVYQFNRVADMMQMDPAIRERLSKPDREIRIKLPITLADGTQKTYWGYRVQHNDARGPYKGGIRFHPEVDFDDVRALAAGMTWKTALLNLPYGGAKGGVNVDPREMSKRDLERLTRIYTQELSKLNFIGPDKDIPAPDINTSAETMGWMMDQYERDHGGHHYPAIVTGKPLSLGGSEGRASATGRGAFFVLQAACKDLGVELSRSTAVVQGFGNVGFHAAKNMFDAGVKIIGISTVDGAIHAENGINIDDLQAFLKTGRKIQDYPRATPLSSADKILELPTNILVPAALGEVINARNADRIHANIILEGANHPTTPKADEILAKKRIDGKPMTIIPDILTNAGGVTVSYFEWVQNTQNKYWKPQDIDTMLNDKMTEAYRAVKAKSDERKISMRDAAFMIAIERVAQAMYDRGSGI